MHQCKRLLLVAVVMLPLLFIACKKNTTTNNLEASLQIAVEPDLGTTAAVALSATYNFNVIIQSTMPPQGVTVTVTYKKDGDNSVLFAQTLQTSTSPLNVSITNIPANVSGTVTVEAVSKTKADNTASKSFKLVRK